MRIIETISNIEKIKKGCVLTIGNFDGVHIGHREILTAAKKAALERKTELTVMSFEPHPLAVLCPQRAPGILTPLPLKKQLLAESGVDCFFFLQSSQELLNLSPTEFVDRFFGRATQPSVVVEGQSFNFGYGRSGNVHTLHSLGTEKGFLVSIIEAKEVRLSIGQAVKISSTMIRNILESGKVADAAIALGRPYRLMGKIISGRGKGRQLGFPTVNLQPPDQLIPAEGVYAGFVEIADSLKQLLSAKQRVPAALSIGRSETLGSDYPLSIEAHLLTENPGDIHDKWLAMDFIEYIRCQRKFNNEADLADQIAKDCEKAKEILPTDF